MKVIKDERLIIKNLKNIRIAFIFQTICMIGMLIYEGITNGFMNAFNHPLWLVLLSTTVLLGYLNITISVDSYENDKISKIPYYFIVLGSLGIGVIFSLIMLFDPNSTAKDAVMVGVILFVCFLVPFSIGYYLIKKRARDVEL